jgi:HD-GYP domain-containing protein (c-di-GMP phosphodiesterase class II)
MLHSASRLEVAGQRVRASETIPIGARIVAVAMVFEMLVRDRPHRGAIAFATVRAEIQRWSGRQFDPRIVDVFLNVPDEDWKRASSNI